MFAKHETSKKLCPSYYGKIGAQLFGVVNKNGNVQFITPLTVTEEFINQNQNLEQRFRFTGKCIEKGCEQWHDEKSICSLPNKIKQKDFSQKENLQYCPIQNQCRWFSQDGKFACYGCNEITRNMEELIMGA